MTDCYRDGGAPGLPARTRVYADQEPPADSGCSVAPLAGAELADEVAHRVVELLADRPLMPSWLTPADVATLLAVDRAFVYEHAADLGARKLGDGPKARLRFRLEDVEAALPCLESRGSQERATPSAKPKQRRRSTTRLGTGASLLPIRDDRRPS